MLARNAVDVIATNAGSLLDLTGTGGPDTVTITNSNPNTLLGLVNIDEAPGSTNLVIDLSTDGLAHTLDLSSDGTSSTLHDELGNMNDVTYSAASLASLTIDADGNEDQILNLNFGGGGNPIPTASSPGLIYNAGGNGQATSQAMNILGTLPSGAFTSEIHNANDESVFPQVGQYGSIFFTDSTGIASSLDYTGLQPITDTTPAVTYTFNDFADDQSFTATSSTVPGFDTVQFANTPVLGTPPTFETTNVANKTNIVFNTPTGTFSGEAGIIGVVNVPTPSTGLAALAFNTPTNSDNTVAFDATPPGVATSLGAGAAEDVTNVNGTGVAAGTTLIVNGGASFNTLNYDAGGGVPTVTPGLLTGEVLMNIPGAGTVDALNYEQINITDPAAPPPVVINATALSINSIENFQLVGCARRHVHFSGHHTPAQRQPAACEPAGQRFHGHDRLGRWQHDRRHNHPGRERYL